ncbi:MAG: pseudaminic acid cytidylyltransferase [Proteobacteria bacterium]|nr:pseudaminic acid cytidylyltransferase [Pseudomonadota bacterium]MBU1416920.1 pseudaminic acid cytidylyltransferase [Pseudomonadota bacterium]MBU1456707.1 pseudaminic acid cytidylyltransferase [Pseudomonadota bacterium]
MRAAIIPARGGSKRIPKKNIRLFAGKPIIAHSIETAKKSGLFDKIIVSTDDQEIAETANKFGAETPFIRPPELSDDFTGTHEVVSHAVKWLLDSGMDVQEVCCIYATAPFIQQQDLVKGLELLNQGKWGSVFAATRFTYPIFRSFSIQENGGVKMFFPEHFNSRSQDLPEAVHDAGQFYWAHTKAWLEPSKGFGDSTTVVLLPSWRVLDIDTVDDWHHAELIFKVLEQEKE